MNSKSLLLLSPISSFLKRITSIVLLIILSISTAFTPNTSSQKVDTNAKIKAVFIYNFTKYIEWPQEYKTGEFYYWNTW